MENRTVARCLRGEVVPPPRDFCSPAWQNAQCLRSEVPAWGVPYRLVRKCFQCCLRKVLHCTGLDVNRLFWHKRLMLNSYDPWDRSIPKQTIGAKRGLGSSSNPDDEESLDDGAVLLNHFALLRYAHLGSTYAQSAVLTAPNSSARTPRPFTLVAIDGWTNRQHYDALAQIKQRLAHLPPPIIMYVRADEYLPHPNSRFSSVLENSLVSSWWSDNPHTGNGMDAWEKSCLPGAPTPKACHEPMEKHSEAKIQGWPRGLSNSLVWHRLLSQDKYSAAQLVRDRPKLLFCGCFTIATMGNGPRANKAEALRRNGFKCRPNCARGAGNEAAFHYKFVVSMRGNSAQNYRDWEALQAGAIPLVDYDEVHQPMWEGLPVVAVRNWSTVTAPFLEETFAQMRWQSYSWKKLYFPFWLDHMLFQSGLRSLLHDKRDYISMSGPASCPNQRQG